MKLDDETLLKVAHLSRLNIEEGEKEKLLQDMSNILTWVEKLNEVATDHVAPLISMTYEVNAFREDKIGSSIEKENALQLAPEHNKDFFLVPKVIE